MDGATALAFARERYTYKEGDRHRGENQEQVISKLVEKITSSKTLLTKSSDILKSLEGTFETSITTDANFPNSFTNLFLRLTYAGVAFKSGFPHVATTLPYTWPIFSKTFG